MREVDVEQIAQTVAQLCIQANRQLPKDLVDALVKSNQKEDGESGKRVLCDILRNVDAAQAQALPICQDTGMACVFVEWGQEVHLAGGSLEDAVNEGVRRGYEEGYLRKSVVRDPLRRENTKDNTPALLHTDLLPGDQLRITVLPKGFGSENMSRLAMLTPADGEEGVRQFVLDTVKAAGPNPCPPVVVGVGIGGSFDAVAALSKRALLREIGTPHPDPFYACMEAELLEEMNKTGIGPAGYGGRTTALGVAIEVLPTHIAGLPVAVNISCHVTRRASALL